MKKALALLLLLVPAANAASSSALRWESLGRVALARESWSDALADFDSALRLEPGRALSLSGRGRALDALDRPGASLEAFNKALRAAPKLAEAYAGRAALNARMGNPALAEGDLKTACRLGDEASCAKSELRDAVASKRDAAPPQEAYFPARVGDRAVFVEYHADPTDATWRRLEPECHWREVMTVEAAAEGTLIVIRESEGRLSKEEGHYRYGAPGKVESVQIYLRSAAGVRLLDTVSLLEAAPEAWTAETERRLAAYRGLSAEELAEKGGEPQLTFPAEAGASVAYGEGLKAETVGPKFRGLLRSRPDIIRTVLFFEKQWRTIRHFKPGVGLVAEETLTADPRYPVTVRKLAKFYPAPIKKT